VIFLPPRAVALRVKPQNQILLGEPLAVQRGSEDELRYSGSDARGLRYDVYVASESEVLVEPMTPTERSRYLALPGDLPPRVVDLAHQWTDGLASNEAKARAIEDHLRREYGYDLKSPSQGTAQPVDHFLFESHRGHCEFFSTAMAMMLRGVGIPSRNVTGFVGGTWNRWGHYYAVREGDAHSWVEAYLDHPTHPGWMTFDPTPPSGAQPLEPRDGFYYLMRDFVEALSQRWSTYVVGYDLRKQVHLFDEVSRLYDKMRSTTGVDKGPLARLTRGRVVVGVLVVGVALGYVAWKRRRRKASTAEEKRARREDDVRVETAAALYRLLESALHGQGVTRAASTPPLRHAEELCSRRHPLAGEVLALTNVYLATRFGGVDLSDTTRREFERRVREIRIHRPERAPGATGSSRQA
jgi:hypothetical protein